MEKVVASITISIKWNNIIYLKHKWSCNHFSIPSFSRSTINNLIPKFIARKIITLKRLIEPGRSIFPYRWRTFETFSFLHMDESNLFLAILINLCISRGILLRIISAYSLLLRLKPSIQFGAIINTKILSFFNLVLFSFQFISHSGNLLLKF